ncbi:MAG: hypothetical protein A2Z71_05805 [Chloroflexi bacterium RBG_13_50_21]|nr:MAG: hypothetical protein A2Z71_05805 [Chloroflexi bacterium RBG_13_50_21]
MRDEEIRKLREERDHLRNWLTNLGSAQDIASEVQKKLEQIEWELAALENSPEEADEITTAGLVVDIDRDYRTLHQALPMIPNYNPSLLAATDTTTASGTASVFEFVTRVGDLGTPKAQEYSNDLAELYFGLYTSEKRPDEIRKLLGKLGNQNTSDRFEEAYKDFYTYKGGVGDKKKAALSMRNFLEGVKGDLWSKAKTHEKENMTWETMANRLGKKTASDEEKEILVEQD